MQINGITLTQREIDVIACIINGRRTKSISSLLDLSVRTISVHIANILRKIDGNSQEQIISFIESANLHIPLRQRYIYLTYFQKFKKLLKEISKECLLETCYLYNLNSNNFNCAIKESFEFLECNVVEITDIHSITSSDKNILIAPHSCLENISKIQIRKILCVDKVDTKLSEYQLICTQEGYFQSFFKILDKLSNGLNNTFNSKEFTESYKKNIQNDSSRSLPNYKNWIICVLIAISVICLGTFSIDWFKPQISNIITLESSKFLKRTNLISRIDTALKSKNKLAIIVGEGGSGKTTLVRNYLKSKKCKISWEINAESESSILKSLTNLAMALAEHGDLNIVFSISDEKLRLSKLLIFIANKLNGKDWILLYDGMDNIENIQQYFPKTNEPGSIIVTSRNTNLENLHYLELDAVVQMGLLSFDEKTNLFYNYLGNNSKNFPMKELISELPALPLDICAAAYYQKETGETALEYVNLMKKPNLGFYKTQEKLLKNNLNYGETRYSIITSGLKRLILQNPNYRNLMFLLFMLNSHDILKEYFSSLEDKFVINQFIYDLKKYSTINSHDNLISIHKVNQDVGFDYICKLLTPEEISSLLEKIIHKFCSYKETAWYLYESKVPGFSVSKVKDRHPHFISILNHLDLLPISQEEKSKFRIKIMLAILHVSKYIKSEKEIAKYAEKIIHLNEKHNTLSQLDLAVLFEICGNKNIFLNIEKSKNYLKKALKITEKTPNSRCIRAICLSDYAKIFGIQGDIESVESFLNESINMLKPSEEFWKLQTRVTIFNRYAECLNNYYESSPKLKKILDEGNTLLTELDANKFFYKTNDYNGQNEFSIFMIRRNMTATSNRLGKFDDAMENLKEAEFFLKKFIKKESFMAKHESTLSIDMGAILLRKNKLTESIEILTKALENKEKIDDLRKALPGYIFKSEAFIRLGKYSEAEAECVKALAIQKTNVSNSLKCFKLMLLYNIAIINNHQKDSENALSNLNKLTNVSKEVCAILLSDLEYQTFKDQKNFETTKNLKIAFSNAKKILSSIYGKNHPYISDYVDKFPS